MNVAMCLKKVREVVVAGERDLFSAIYRFAESGEEAHEAITVLEQIATPARAEFDEQTLRWVRTKALVDGLQAVQLAKAASSERSLWEWLQAPGRKRLQVMQVLNVAILKS